MPGGGLHPSAMPRTVSTAIRPMPASGRRTDVSRSEELLKCVALADSLGRFTLTVPDSGVLEIEVGLTPWAVMSLRQAA